MAWVTTDHKWLQLDSDLVARYNAWDTFSAAKIVAPLSQELKDTENWDFFQRWFAQVGPVVQDMQRRGFGQLDHAALKELRAKYRKEIAEVEKAIRGKMKDSSAYTSKFFGSTQPKGGQRAKFIYDELGLRPPPTTHKRPERSTSQEALGFVLQHMRKMDEPHREVLYDLFHRSRLNTIKSRYLNVEEHNGRLRPTVKLAGAESFRLAYARPALQQWPPETRRAVRAARGHVFVAADARQLEGRISAHLAGDDGDLAVFNSGGDIHEQNAKDLFGLTDSDWILLGPNIRKQTRNWAKMWRYAIGYGADPSKPGGKLFCPCPRCAASVPQTLALSRSQVKEAATRWEAKHKPTVRWRDQLVREVLESGRKYTSPWGYTRAFFAPMPGVRNEIWNYPLQHAAACYINDCMVELHRAGLALCFQHHDSIVLEAPQELSDEWADQLRGVMEAPIRELSSLRIPVEVKVGESWGEL